MESIIVENFMREVFEKARKDSGTQVRDAVVKHIERCISEICDTENWQSRPMSYKTLERYHKKYAEQWEEKDISGFKVPDGDFRFQLSRYLGYGNYLEYLSKHQKGTDTRTEIFIAHTITKTDTLNGDIIIN